MIKVRVYIDGYNLFYGRLHHRDTKPNNERKILRWLNLEKLVKQFLYDDCKIESINFYTADALTLYEGHKAPINQQEYFKALKTIPNLNIIKGRFSKNIVKSPIYPIEIENKIIKKQEIIKIEEKKSDVNIATNLICDAFKNSFDLAIIITNDSDLLAPIKVVKELKKDFLILCPHNKICSEFNKEFTRKYIKYIQQKNIELAQFDDYEIKDKTTDKILATCPNKWRKR